MILFTGSSAYSIVGDHRIALATDESPRIFIRRCYPISATDSPRHIFLASLLGISTCLGTASTSPVVGFVPEKNGRLLFQDTFSQKKLQKAWRVQPNSFRIEKGVLIAGQRPGKRHGAVSRISVEFKDVILEFSFLLDGSGGFNVVMNDHKYRGSHAGHICRVVIQRRRILLRDDKTGAMKNGLFEKRRDPQNRRDEKIRREIQRLLDGKSQSVPISLKRGRWYRMTVRISGKTMQVSLDGKPLASLKSEGIAHPTKTDFGFTVIGRFAKFDNISVRSLKPAHQK